MNSGVSFLNETRSRDRMMAFPGLDSKSRGARFFTKVATGLTNSFEHSKLSSTSSKRLHLKSVDVVDTSNDKTRHPIAIRARIGMNGSSTDEKITKFGGSIGDSSGIPVVDVQIVLLHDLTKEGVHVDVLLHKERTLTRDDTGNTVRTDRSLVEVSRNTRRIVGKGSTSNANVPGGRPSRRSTPVVRVSNTGDLDLHTSDDVTLEQVLIGRPSVGFLHATDVRVLAQNSSALARQLQRDHDSTKLRSVARSRANTNGRVSERVDTLQLEILMTRRERQPALQSSTGNIAITTTRITAAARAVHTPATVGHGLRTREERVRGTFPNIFFLFFTCHRRRR